MQKRMFEAPCARAVYVEATEVIATSNVRISSAPMGNGDQAELQMYYLMCEEEEEEF